MGARSAVIIAIPVKNEEARIGFCLDALARQAGMFDQLVLLLNNCTDATLETCEQFSGRFGQLKILQHELPPDLASAGEARRLVLNHAMKAAGAGIILTTDADAVPGENWVSENLRVLEQGADVVCGRVELDPFDAPKIPAALHIDAAREARLLSIQDEIVAMVDPSSIDPWPRHQDHSGASIAMRAAILRQAGGAPHVPSAEDRALIHRLQLMDARIRHAEIVVRVSGRLVGRAAGGMADTIMRRLRRPDIFTDARLEPTVDAYRRALAKARLRGAMLGGVDADGLAEDLLIGAAAMCRVKRAKYFGSAWAEAQLLSPVLQRRQVLFSNLDREILQALTLCDRLREELEVSQIIPQASHDVRNVATDENAA
jgi:glycosyltransferase involved in cell wall biosynthesis